MGMSHEEMDRVVDDHFRFEATDDLDGVMASFAPGPLRHEIIPSPIGEISDRQDIRDYYTMLYACAQGDKATCIRRLYGDDFLVDETLWEGTIGGHAELLQHPLHGGRMPGQEAEQRSTSDHQAPRRGHRAEAQPPDADRVEQPHLAGDRDPPEHAQDHLAPIAAHPVRLSWPSASTTNTSARSPSIQTV